jgi:hypothetical protein
MDARRTRYNRLHSRLAQLSDDELKAPEGLVGNPGWGRNHTIELDGEKVFVKRVPITEREREDPLSTRNRYGLPTFYNYGVGSAGMGAGRELGAHLQATEWALKGKCEGFPLLYHYRVVPFSGERAPLDEPGHQEYVRYWAGHEAVDRYLRERAAASHELLLVIEYLPHMLHTWLRANPGHLEATQTDLHRTLAFLRQNGMVHFDAHFHNVLTDGERTYLTDFGLALSDAFELTEEERAFFARHALYDYGRCASCMGLFFPQGSPEEVRAQMDSVETQGLDPSDTACIVRYRDAYRVMNDFYWTLADNPRKDTPFPAAEFAKALPPEALSLGERGPEGVMLGAWI